MSQTFKRIADRVSGTVPAAPTVCTAIVAASGSLAPAVVRVTPEMHKARHRFVPASDPGFAYSGAWGTGNDGVMISKEVGAAVTWGGPVQGAIPVLLSHPYSGVVSIEAPGHAHLTDNYSWFTFARAFPLAPTVQIGPLRITVAGRNPLARAAEVVLAGIWVPQDEIRRGGGRRRRWRRLRGTASADGGQLDGQHPARRR